jgi:hypothetical protein
MPVGIESNSFKGFVKMSSSIKNENTKLENLINFLKMMLSIWQYKMYVIEKYSTIVKRRNEYISDCKYLILNLVKIKSEIKE